MNNTIFRVVAGGLFLLAAISCNTQTQSGNKQTGPAEAAQNSAKQHYQVGDQVPNELVCMVNDAYMGKPQIAVPVNGKTYYGCCQMCVKKLNEQESSRMAIDPASGKKVDKVDAYIVLLDEQGTVGYFESEDSYTAFGKNN
ncbi:MAG: hypothetical protein LPK25_15015 [Cyclobacteriaceae bacterium]|uniref:hypothetical protein n=1 Tax=Croceimicrobium sp. TaxID=2828340 RepID=UPI0029C3B155|nr:hypothetical protein [Cyclobacteriaceae bacterium]